MKRTVITAVASLGLTAIGHGFELSASYTPSTVLYAGYYACRSGLDFSTFTSQFDVMEDGSYMLRGQDGAGRIVMAPDGVVEFDGGPFMSDATARTSAMNATRLSDGNAVIIIRYDFGAMVTDDYCALVE